MIRQMLLDRDFRVALDKSLVHQAAALVKLLQLAFDNFCDCLGRFVLDLFGGDFLLLRQSSAGTCSREMTDGWPAAICNVMSRTKLLEFLRAHRRLLAAPTSTSTPTLAPV